ncbi:hypothetical protein C5167_006134 [Papaver somniferum]|uniref:Uncharacterized protein n=1 Tax=Papaver somniferum TaxID=3469 RepID=A0A4Y7JGE8_PAPSO|nr:uncharacterized protein LOC113274089 [Papaver somniferum]RZC58829.1 hypothetical protein C5167_006134 [Papaver somniferum]
MSRKETTVLVNEAEWVLCNDNGFVYKKKKRNREEKSSSTTTSASDGGIVDLEIELKKKGLRRRKHTLMKLKDKYKKECVHWGNLSNSLKEIEERNQNQQQLHIQSQPSTSASSYKVREMGQTEEACSGGSLIDDLLLQEEMREGMIRDLSELCDAAEAMYKAEEEQLKQSFFDLPVWASPRSLLASLSDQDCFSNNKENGYAQLT